MDDLFAAKQKFLKTESLTGKFNNFRVMKVISVCDETVLKLFQEQS